LTRHARWLWPLAWTALIAWGSTGQWGAPTTRGRLVPLLAHLLPWLTPDAIEGLHWLFRKAGHVTEYGVLGFLWGWALGGWRRAAGLSMLTAFLDELHQATTLVREGSAADFVLDSTSALAALATLRAGVGAALEALTTALLWAAAAGGTLLLAFDVAAGAPSGWLWLTTPGAWLILALRRHRGSAPAR
jgi:hypothetical protein